MLAWYDEERRDLPWRAAPGKRADPYSVWLSEIMLQQTTVKAVIPYLPAVPRPLAEVTALASAPLDDVLAAWAGLGYYSARAICTNVPRWSLRSMGAISRHRSRTAELPGIGPYTAAAIAAIAFGKEATPVDGNIERVVARLFAVREPLPAAKSRIEEAGGDADARRGAPAISRRR